MDLKLKKDTTCDCSVTKPELSHVATQGNGRTKLYIALGVGLALWVFVYYWLESASNFLTYDVFKLPVDSHLGSSVSFFLFDAPKVIMLLLLIVFAVGIIRSFFTPERTRQILAGKKLFVGNIMAAGLGIVTPFCTCSAIPLFIGFVEAGVPLGITLSFLIASPMINEVAVILLFGMFGWRVAVIYIVTGLVIAIVAGWVIGKLGMEKYIENWVFEIKMAEAGAQSEKLTFEDRIRYGLTAVRDIVSKVWPYILAGIAVGAGIHGYVPDGLLASFMGEGAWWSVPAAVIIGIPMYSNAAGIIPVVQALIEKGAALGTALAFMMAVIGLSLPEMIILRRVLKWRLIGVFIGVVGIGILIVGYLFNVIL
ncbi:MAG: hypothetical protein A2Z02_00630 [Chloroflexi bacterium RBG_16_48_7]|nr:MAG: hypothetical protein A2Z02_00630 [Chloroflexi bacterium RBG_16_48_7]